MTAYDPATDHEPMFDLEPAAAGSLGERDRARTQRSIGRGHCPECAGLEPVGVVRQGEHTAWRVHMRTMGSGVRLECRASGVPLCQAPAKPARDIPTPRCACGTSR